MRLRARPWHTATAAMHPSTDRDAVAAADLLARLFRQVDADVALRLWNGMLVRLGHAGRAGTNTHAEFTLVCHSPDTVRQLVFGRDPLRLAEAYFRGALDVEGDFFAALSLKDRLHQMHLTWHDGWAAMRWAARGHAHDVASPWVDTQHPASAVRVRQHTEQENRAAIAFHYDLSNAFYALWLDRAMVYSCAYFKTPDTDLDTAQFDKLDHICRKLMLQPGERFLDIGCGWGALVIHAARHYGVRAHGITLSHKQWEWAQARIAKESLQDQVSVDLCDYRQLPASAAYDKVASVGMFEHIGLRQWPQYCTIVHGLLAPGGLFLNHGITHADAGWTAATSSAFINRYVFPDGQLDRVSSLQRCMENADFEIADVESLRAHYARTLRHWVRRLETHHDQAVALVGEPLWRIWRLYMAASALEFESGELNLYQVLACKRDGQLNQLPLTREHLYAPRHPLVHSP